jgi:hypothetical protein
VQPGVLGANVLRQVTAEKTDTQARSTGGESFTTLHRIENIGAGVKPVKTAWHELLRATVQE